jgi:hypothetical protein
VERPALVLAMSAGAAAADSIVLGMGCFWGAEKRMAELPGVIDVESGYANGDIPGTYKDVLAHAQPGAAEDRLRAGHRASRQRFASGRETSGDVRRSDHRRGAVPQRHQVRERHRLAEFLQPLARRAHRTCRHLPRHAPR